MPSSRIAHGDPSPDHADPRSAFQFPSNAHLVITTQRNVLSWDSDGINSIFQSESSGIFAAKEVRDGSGTLAVADGQSLVLQTERSYRPKGIEGNIRLLEFAENSRQLYFTTNLHNAVECYSIQESRLLAPAHTHPSPPTVLALSRNSQLLLSASESPPTIYLQNLLLGGRPFLFQPGVSDTPVSTASFHPERPQVFLLSFKDGSLAAYDASRLVRMDARASAQSHIAKQGRGGEIGRFAQLHTVARHGSALSGIVGVKFLPGHRSRAVTVGCDGKCRIVNFDYGGKILKTWHVQGPGTSLSLLPEKWDEKRHLAASTRRTGSRTIGDGVSQEKMVIAVGRQDGKVLLFSSDGHCLCEKVINPDGGRIIDVEWIQGESAKVPPGSARRAQNMAEEIVDITVAPENTKSFGTIVRSPTGSHTSSNPFPGCHQLQAAAPAGLEDETTGLPEPNTTIKHTTSANMHALLPPMPGNHYMDLFSPVKGEVVRRKSKSPPKRSSRARPRPRISSTTFLDEDEPSQSNADRIALGPATGNGTNLKYSPIPSPIRNTPAKGSPLKPPHKVNRKRTLAYRVPGRYVSSGSSQPSGSSVSSKTSNILADLRRAGAGEGSSRSLFAPYIERRVSQASSSRNSPLVPTLPPSRPQSTTVSFHNGRDACPPEAPPVSDDLWLTDLDSDPETGYTRHTSFLQRRSNRTHKYRRTSSGQSPRMSSQDTPPFASLTTGGGRSNAASPTDALYYERDEIEDNCVPIGNDASYEASTEKTCTCKGEYCGELRETIAGLRSKIRVLEGDMQRLKGERAA
ncbi:hypothetical protein P152DRAFT_453883 [Eremomyces bilateralis CBS 781.70]|uniref:WD40 repeat-like protein n=1 Tax=Eremomyces bilateralis CBS 781.70 TaxID=1392243 RepID=A0A6G1GGX7_9PEZI|nr:uncharacterized protein P152DRAFT_453883 [Eremomyces bilateralis CBS 781.70]KAF1817303.1 hypothetical protein P152DRAFT_453883 [Eremomyces bilateralis CBS 781.70]